MKNYNKPAISKLVARFDEQLKNILMEDLKSFNIKTKFINSNNQVLAQSTLSAA